ncbi:flagellin N-terminal helical domain-containing protein [Selenomonas ruminantium]|uniref:Flagellin n=1 Tax=Selenomonas ruminantium TaxID=971 RepID=A0A1K1N988_SELRU|nr:flagellin [Selenomonas ruminantium]SFW31857.1 flagellin [Selenomonas ruminantium]
MAMVVKNNMSAISTLNTLNKNSSALAKSLEKVSSGMKINGAADDASGYAISERMRVQIRGLDQANANTQNGNAMMKVAEGAVSSTVDILKTLKEKVINAANDTNTDADRQTIQKELDQSIDQIDDNANITYNGKYLVDGSHNNKVTQTSTHLTNESLGKNQTSNTNFTELTNRTGDKLNIQTGDTVTVSYVKNGKTYSTSAVIGVKVNNLDEVLSKLTGQNGGEKGDKLSDVMEFTSSGTATYKIGTDASGQAVYTADKGCAITLRAKTGGVEGQIAGFTISISNKNGAINKSANAALDNFSETIRAENTSADNAMVFQVGTKANQAIKVGLTDMRSTALGLKGFDGQTLSVSTQVKANAAINVLDNAIQKALDQQTTIGSVESRLSYTSSNLTTASENVQSSESTIRDADMAKEMTNYTKNNVLLQAAQSMLAQANQSSSSVLSLLQ